MDGPRRSAIAVRIEDDAGVAGVVGAVLVLALVVFAFGQVAHNDLPRWGIEVQREWDVDVHATMSRLATDAARGIATESLVTGAIPPAPDPRALDVPFVGPLEPLPPSATLSLAGNCGGIRVNHTPHGLPAVLDVATLGTPCLSFRAAPAYGAPFEYRIEAGAVVRVQGERAVLVQGPSVKLDTSNATAYNVTLVVPVLAGISTSATAAESGVAITLLPIAGVVESLPPPNAARTEWRIETAHPKAWKTWFEREFELAGFVASRVAPPPASSADYSISCAPLADCSLVAGKATVVVAIEGPRTNSNDIRLAISHGTFDVRLA